MKINPTRPGGAWRVAAGALLVLAGGRSADPSQAQAAEAVRGSRPNIIFIVADDLGYGDLGSYGQQAIRTPQLDQMAKQGLRFTRVYAGSTVCAPARSVLMTGQHTGRTRVRGNFGRGGVRGLGGGDGRVPLRQEDVTVAEVLKDAGYVTGITGKWGLGEPDTPGTPNRKGFDEWFGYLNQRRAHEYYPEFLWENENRVTLEGNLDGRQEQYSHDLISDWALAFVRRHGGGDAPFFLYLPYCIPHAKFQIPELEPYAADADWPRQAKVYASMITRMDRDIGRMFALLAELDIDDNTIVFFCSDNGAADRYEGLFDSSGVLRGRKRSMYDGGLRTPMIVRWPARVPADETSDAIWYFADVLPTFAELAGATAPADIDGVSVVPSLLGQAQPELQQRPLYWEFYESGFQQAARKGDWKAVRLKHGEPLELYDLREDPGERKNLAQDHPDRVAWFERYLREAREPSPHWPAPVD